jgi:hypothetical protein
MEEFARIKRLGEFWLRHNLQSRLAFAETPAALYSRQD